jgi:hypothetical protein
MFVSSTSSPYLVSISWEGEVNTTKSWKFDDMTVIGRPITGKYMQIT